MAGMWWLTGTCLLHTLAGSSSLPERVKPRQLPRLDLALLGWKCFPFPFCFLQVFEILCQSAQCYRLLARSASGHQIFGFIRPELHDLVHAEQDEGQEPEAPADGRCDPPVVIHTRGAARGCLPAEVHVWGRRREVSSREAKYLAGFLH